MRIAADILLHACSASLSAHKHRPRVARRRRASGISLRGWPNVTKVVDGVTCNGTSTPKTMTVAGVTYTQAQLLLLMPSGVLHTSGHVNALSQFIAGVLNLAAGAQDNAAIDSAISTIN
jgi:hypothetical protein